MTEFFDKHVRGSARIDFNELLRPLGLEMHAAPITAVNERGEPDRDLRIRAFQPTPQDTLRLMFWNAGSNWVRGGLNTNDRVLSVNGTPVRTWPEFRGLIGAAPMGTTVRFDIVRNGKRMEIPVAMAGYSVVRVTVREIPNASAAQRALREQWLAGN
jgi:predicted metalloprotease with PDZ domain